MQSFVQEIVMAELYIMFVGIQIIAQLSPLMWFLVGISSGAVMQHQVMINMNEK